MNETDLQKTFNKIRNGDREAFTLLYSDLKQPIYTIICRIVQSRETAEDITQDVFVKLFVSPPEPSVKNTRAWIFRMARNSAIDALRRKRSNEDIDETEAAGEDELEPYVWKWDIEKAMSRLSCSEREIVSLHLNGELGFADIAKIVNQSLPSVYRTYRRALKNLREYLNGGYE